MKTCPFCAEEIQDAAIVCKHCGRDLNDLNDPRKKAEWYVTPPKGPAEPEPVAWAEIVRRVQAKELPSATKLARQGEKPRPTWEFPELKAILNPKAKPAASGGQSILNRPIGGGGCLLVLLLMGFCSLLTSRTPSTPGASSRPAATQPRQEHSESIAQTICKELVKASLKSPSTADFPWTDYRRQTHGGGKYTVRSYVDAQNSFGATLRSQWRCTITYGGSGSGFLPQNWTINDLTIE